MKIKNGWIALASSLLLLGAIFVLLRGNNLASLLQVWRRLDSVSLFSAVICVLAMQLAAAWRLKIIMAADHAEAKLASLFRIQLLSQFIAHGAPISALADLAKVAILALRYSFSSGRALRLIVYERALGAIGMVCIGAIFLGFQFLVAPIPSHVVNVEAIFWASGLLGIVVLIGLSSFHVVTRIGLLNRVIHGVFRLGFLLLQPSFAMLLLAATTLQLIFMGLSFLVLANAMNLSLSATQVMLFMPFISFIASLPIFYLGWGAREAAVILTIGASSSISSSEAVALSVAFGVCVLLAALPGGIFWLMRPSMRKAVKVEVDRLQTSSNKS
jgi:uncharacterized membrane protein YbhN (UPF0104 family)